MALLLVAILGTLAWSTTLAVFADEGVYLPLAGVGALVAGLAVALRPHRTLELLRPRGGTVAIGLAGGVLLTVLTHLGTWIAGALFPSVAAEVAALYTIVRAPPGAALSALLLVVIVTAEEIVWRGPFLDTLERRAGRSLALVSGTAIYALSTVGSGSILLMAAAFGCGLVWTMERWATRGLVAPVLTHLVWDLGVLLLFPLDRLVVAVPM